VATRQEIIEHFSGEQRMQAALSVLGRIMLCTIFLSSAVGNKIPNFSRVIGYMQMNNLTWQPELLLGGAIVFLIVGSVLVVLGYQARIGAALLLVFLALATYYFHDFWDPRHGDMVELQTIQFMKNLGLGGALLFIIANGSGAGSLDRLWAKPVELSSR
jgi:putative oxidoreductase